MASSKRTILRAIERDGQKHVPYAGNRKSRRQQAKKANKKKQ